MSFHWKINLKTLLIFLNNYNNNVQIIKDINANHVNIFFFGEFESC